jgi:crotonobetaine/carnitine-CoA ligase
MVGREAVSYGHAYSQARAVATGLAALDVQQGDYVLIMAENTEQSLFTWLGVSVLGAVEVAINTAYRGRSLEHALQNSQAKVMFIDEHLLPRLTEIPAALSYLETVIVYKARPQPPLAWPSLSEARMLTFRESLGDPSQCPEPVIHPHDIASVVYTSGTTGPAKGVMMPHGQISLFARLGVEGARMTADDVHYCFIPLFHVAGKYMAIYGSMITGGSVVIDTHFSAETWLPRVREYGATLSHVHGPLVEMLYRQPEAPDDADNPVSRIIASPFPAKIAKDFERRFGLRGIETWGMTEITVPVWQPYEENLRVGCCGRVRAEHFELRIVDPDTDAEMPTGEVGELVLRPHNPWTIMQGYLRMPEETLKRWRNLWFHTGDLGYLDSHRYLYFVDRANERIRRRAENISSYEIEAAALEHPDVRECAAVGVPSEFDGDDDVQLCVVLSSGSTTGPQALLKHLVNRLPPFMVPRYISVVEDMPRTPLGKIQKSLLRKEGVTERTWDRKTAGLSLRSLADQHS